MDERPKVKVFSDGSCIGNPGPGGYGVVLLFGNVRKELSCGYRRTTNNRMEMLGAIVGLKALKRPCCVVLSTDSQYLRQGITQWIRTWKRNGWKTVEKKPVKNIDLWVELDKLTCMHAVEWNWVKGHAGVVENERCDQLARAAAEGCATEVDNGFEAP